jgi:hypothetical protein
MVPHAASKARHDPFVLASSFSTLPVSCSPPPQQGITIPQVREVPDYAANQAAAAPAVAAAMANAHAAGYTRYLELLPNMYEEHCMADYDMDSEDEDWLRKVNSKVGGVRVGLWPLGRAEDWP